MKTPPPIRASTLRHFRPFVFVLLVFSCGYSPGQTVPPLINYQGQLSGPNGTNLPTADYELRFNIYDAATSGNLVWGPQVFNGQTGPGYGPKIPVVQGYFNVMLGPVDTNGNSLLNAFNATNRFVEIKVGTNNPISPRQQILSAPYALKAEAARTAESLSFVDAAGNRTEVIHLYTNGVPTISCQAGLYVSDGISVGGHVWSLSPVIGTYCKETAWRQEYIFPTEWSGPPLDWAHWDFSGNRTVNVLNVPGTCYARIPIREGETLRRIGMGTAVSSNSVLSGTIQVLKCRGSYVEKVQVGPTIPLSRAIIDGTLQADINYTVEYGYYVVVQFDYQGCSGGTYVLFMALYAVIEHS